MKRHLRLFTGGLLSLPPNLAKAHAHCVAAGMDGHRGSKKTGGCYATKAK